MAKVVSAGLLGAGRTLGVIGAGVMGKALVKGLIESGQVERRRVWASTKTETSAEEVSRELEITAAKDYAELVPDAGLLLVAVKPGQTAAVAEYLRRAGLRPDTLVITVMAGVTTGRMEALLGSENPCVRAMPNTPCLVGEGVTVYCGGRWATGEHLRVASTVFESVGKALAVEEHYFNAITALSGSGPAYMYLVIESLADAGVRVGLPRDLALELVTQTMLGAAKMVQQSGRHPAALRDDVTTPAGCTIGGLLMLEDGKIRSVLARAVEEATRIVDQLGNPKGVQ